MCATYSVSFNHHDFIILIQIMQFLIVHWEGRDRAADWGTGLQTRGSRVIGIFRWHNPSGRTMALESNQPLTEISTINNSWKVNAADAYDWQLYQLHVPAVLKFWETHTPGTLWLLKGLFYLYHFPYFHPRRSYYLLQCPILEKSHSVFLFQH
jgi:hypothetical protein